MDLASILTGALVGLIVGAAIGWLAASTRRPKEAVAPDAERATLLERLSTRDQRLAELDARLTGADDLIRTLHDQLRDAAARTSAAEQRCERIPALESELTERNSRIDAATREIRAQAARIAELETRLAEERNASTEKLGLLTEARQKLADAFQQLSTEALSASQRSFLELARNRFGELQTAEAEKHTARQEAIENLVKPLKESLLKVDEKVQALEVKREGAYAELAEQLRSLAASQTLLQTQAGNLVKALRAPQVRGRWGEIQLKRVVELAGMVEHCDFLTQPTLEAEDGRQRPDMIVRIPGGRSIVVDSKAPLAAYLESIDAPDEESRRQRLREHAGQLRKHIDQLSAKSYWERISPAPELVVLFVPGESFHFAALEQDPGLLEAGIEKRVFLATPLTLIALLRVFEFGWRQEKIAESAREISQLGKTLYDRLHIMTDHVVALGRSLGKAVDSYNAAVGSFEGRVLVSARRFREMGAATGDELARPEPVDKSPRQMQAPESTLLFKPAPSVRSDGAASLPPFAPPPYAPPSPGPPSHVKDGG